MVVCKVRLAPCTIAVLGYRQVTACGCVNTAHSKAASLSSFYLLGWVNLSFSEHCHLSLSMLSISQDLLRRFFVQQYLHLTSQSGQLLSNFVVFEL